MNIFRILRLVELNKYFLCKTVRIVWRIFLKYAPIAQNAQEIINDTSLNALLGICMTYLKSEQYQHEFFKKFECHDLVRQIALYIFCIVQQYSVDTGETRRFRYYIDTFVKILMCFFSTHERVIVTLVLFYSLFWFELVLRFYYYRLN